MHLNTKKSALIRYFFNLLSFFTTLFIIFLSLKKIEGNKIFYFPYQDKLLHSLAYGFLCVTYFWTMKFSWKINNPIYKAVIFSITLGIILEIIQSYLPYRMFDFWDIIANFLGVMVFILIILKKKIKKNSFLIAE